MEYILTHIGYALAVGVVIAILGVLSAVFSQKSQEESERHGYDPAWDKSEYACAGCKFFQACSGGMSSPKTRKDQQKVADELGIDVQEVIKKAEQKMKDNGCASH